MLSNRMKQFREYNNLSAADIAKAIGIDTAQYEEYESGKATPDIDTVTKLAACYKVTVDEFYGYTPRLALYTEDDNLPEADVNETVLKMSDLSWDEAQLVLYYRNLAEKDELIEKITKELYNDDKK